MPADPAALAPALAPLPPPAAAWAYGSAVFLQTDSGDGGGGASEAGPRQLDFMLAVDDAAAWHAANLAANPAHYSAAARALGGAGVAYLARTVGAGVWFNQGCALPPAAAAAAAAASDPPSSALKYGVASLACLVDDLTTWRWLHLAGRLHKPTVRLPTTTHDAAPPSAASSPLDAALAANHAAAAAAALLLLPPTFGDGEWRAAVAGLSYRGDVRTIVRAEAPAKVASIAAGSAAGLDALYRPLLLAGPVGAAGGVARHGSCGGVWTQDPRPAARGALLEALPPPFVARVAVAGGLPRTLPPDAVAAALPRSALAAAVARALANTVAASSARQAVVGLLAAGPAGAAAYVGAKLRKGWGGGKRVGQKRGGVL